MVLTFSVQDRVELYETRLVDPNNDPIDPSTGKLSHNVTLQ